MTISTDARFEVAPSVHARPLHDEVVVLDMAGGEFFSLDEVGARVWERIVAGASIAEVVAALTADYDADAERIERDVLALVGELVTRRLVTAKPVAPR